MIKITNETRTTVNINDLNIGDTFMLNDYLFIMSDEVNVGALNLSCGGEYEELDSETRVIPVDVEIKIIRKVEF